MTLIQSFVSAASSLNFASHTWEDLFNINNDNTGPGAQKLAKKTKISKRTRTRLDYADPNLFVLKSTGGVPGGHQIIGTSFYNDFLEQNSNVNTINDMMSNTVNYSATKGPGLGSNDAPSNELDNLMVRLKKSKYRKGKNSPLNKSSFYTNSKSSSHDDTSNQENDMSNNMKNLNQNKYTITNSKSHVSKSKSSFTATTGSMNKLTTSIDLTENTVSASRNKGDNFKVNRSQRNKHTKSMYTNFGTSSESSYSGSSSGSGSGSGSGSDKSDKRSKRAKHLKPITLSFMDQGSWYGILQSGFMPLFGVMFFFAFFQNKGDEESSDSE